MGKTIEQTLTALTGEEIRFLPTSHSYKLGKRKLQSPSGVSGMLDKSAVLMPWAVKTTIEGIKKTINEDGISLDGLPNLLEDAKKNYRRYLEKAQVIGTDFHNIAQSYMDLKLGAISEEELNKEISVNKETKNAFEGFKAWVSEHDVKPIKTEALVYNKVAEEVDYCGQTDLIAYVDGKKYVVDYKTSKGIYESHIIQTAAYFAAVLRTHEDLEGVIVASFCKEDVISPKTKEIIKKAGTFEAKTISREDALSVFNNIFVPLLLLKTSPEGIKKFKEILK